MDNNSWERLAKVIEWAGMSTHAFAMKIGMKRSENLYRIIRNKENVSIKLAMLIIETYPQLNRNWLIYGDGEMIIDETDIDMNSFKIPYYAVSIEGTMGDISSLKPAYKIYLPMFKGADFAVNFMDKAMEPAIPYGSIILLKKQSIDFIVYGQVYYVETEDMAMVRVLRKSDKSSDEVLLEAANNQRYDTISIKKELIKNVYYVCGTINKF